MGTAYAGGVLPTITLGGNVVATDNLTVTKTQSPLSSCDESRAKALEEKLNALEDDKGRPLIDAQLSISGNHATYKEST